MRRPVRRRRQRRDGVPARCGRLGCRVRVHAQLGCQGGGERPGGAACSGSWRQRALLVTAEATCDSEADFEVAARVAAHLRVPLHRVSFSAVYWTRVFTPFLADYAAGATPNPDALCNAYVKFGAFRRYALEQLMADVVATGHYADVYPAIDMADPTAALPLEHASVDAPAPQLLTSRSRMKDQSDFLSRVQRADLKRVMFPLGSIASKSRVRALAAAAALPAAHAPESMGICFIGKRSLPHFLSQYMTLTPAACIDLDTGDAVGQHPAWQTVTIGQGARISGSKFKYMIAGKCSGSGHEPARVHVVRDGLHAALFTRDLYCRLADVAWCGGAPPLLLRRMLEQVQGGDTATLLNTCMRVRFKLRHRQNDLIPARMAIARSSELMLSSLQTSMLDTGGRDEYVLHVWSDVPLRAAAVGQTLSVYSSASICTYTGLNGDSVASATEEAEPWEDAGRVCIAGAPLGAVGATLWEQGLAAPVHVDGSFAE